MMNTYILAIDIGTSGTKLLLLPTDKGQIHSISCNYKTQYPAPGWAQQHPDDWWQAICHGIPELLRTACVKTSQICAVGVDGISWAPVVLDEEGHVLCDAPLWYDTRATAECQEISQLIGEERVFQLNGNPIQPYYTLPKLMWLRKHDKTVREKMRSVLTSNGYIVYRLTGKRSMDESQAYGWAFYNMGDGTYDKDIADKLDFDLNWLEEACPSTTVVGSITAEASKACGLKEGIPVVAGGLDAACGALGVGVFEPGPIHEQSGSAGGMSICTDRYLPVRGLITGRHVVPNRWLVQGGTVGGAASLDWLRGVLNPTSLQHLSASETGNLANNVVPGSEGLLFLPYMAGERSPVWNPEAKGVFFGLDYSKTSGHMIRSVMEGVTFALHHNLDCAHKAGVALGPMRAAGGAASSRVWMQIKADICGYPIQAVEGGSATAIGCAIVAGVGCGIFSSFEEACQRFVHLEEPYQPRPEYRELYDTLFERYQLLYQQLEPLMKGGK